MVAGIVSVMAPIFAKILLDIRQELSKLNDCKDQKDDTLADWIRRR